jgi:alpha-beta hydrolase superfamily lysophospholipase
MYAMVQDIVLAIHGLGGHSGWFASLAEEFQRNGIEFFAYDLPGFGHNHNLDHDNHSPYTKGHIDSYQEWIDFTQRKYQELKSHNPDARITILGHSLGALVAVNLPNIASGDKLVLSVPGFKGASSTFDLRFMISTARKIIIDKLIFDRDVFVEMPVSEKAKLTPAMTDPLRVGTVTQTLLFEIVKMRGITQKNILKLYTPVLFIQMEGDKVVDNKTQDQYYQVIPTASKAMRVYSGADHDWIWSNLVSPIAQDIIDWIRI